MSHSRWVFTACGLLAAVSAGCGQSGPKLYPASGTVTFEGKPVAGASVLFIPQGGRPALATTDASGKYIIATSGKPGAELGTYTVTVAKAGGVSGEAPAMPGVPTDGSPLSLEQMQKMQEATTGNTRAVAGKKEKPKSPIPEKYAVPAGSDLRATVTEDAAKNVFDFSLTP